MWLATRGWNLDRYRSLNHGGLVVSKWQTKHHSTSHKSLKTSQTQTIEKSFIFVWLLTKIITKKTSETINSKATLSSRTFQEQWQTRGDFPNSCPAHPFLVPSSPSTPSLSSSSSFNRHDYRQLPDSSLMGYLKPTVALIVVDCAMLLWLLTISHKIIENENVAFFIFF